MRKPPRPALAVGKVRYVGDPIAAVVAETIALAKQAAEAIVPYRAVACRDHAARCRSGRRATAVRRSPRKPSGRVQYGNPENVAAAFARAVHVTRLTAVNNRVVICPMEPAVPRSLRTTRPRAGTRCESVRRGAQDAELRLPR